MLIGLLFVAGNAKAACVLGTALCADDRGNVSIAGFLQNGNGSALPSVKKANINTTTPNVVGMEIFCPDCTNFNGALGQICVSTASTPGGYMAVSSATAVTACQ